jgi:hypothetical protein
MAIGWNKNRPKPLPTVIPHGARCCCMACRAERGQRAKPEEKPAQERSKVARPTGRKSK